jgi:hypothetical protein
MSGLNAIEQEIRLLSIARQEIVARGYDISPDSADLLQNLIAKGAWELASNRPAPPHDTQAHRDPGGVAEMRVVNGSGQWWTPRRPLDRQARPRACSPRERSSQRWRRCAPSGRFAEAYAKSPRRSVPPRPHGGSNWSCPEQGSRPAEHIVICWQHMTLGMQVAR